ncbi:type II secretion system F family protein [Succinimonas amylolytica]|uniref:type II secretion system F family protein n=1 Tax=Succinimonas amylolytica TaxID=83769 RepID=UPI0023A80A8E
MAVKSKDFINYKWVGQNRRGKVIKGSVCARSVELVKADLRKQNIQVTEVKEQKNIMGDGPKIKPMDIATLTRQIATMLSAGVPLVQSIELLAQSHDKVAMRKMLAKMCEDVSSGTPFNQALRKFPYYFDKLYCDLVQAAEASGAMEKIFDQLATYKEKGELLKSKIKKALMYPTVIVIIATIVTGILLVYVVPQFEDMFKGFGAELPAFTQFVVNCSRFLQAWWMVILPILIIGGVAFFQAYKRSQKFHDNVDLATLSIPAVGNIIEKGCLARFASTLATTFAAGIPLVDALLSAKGAAGNAKYTQAIDDVRSDVMGGMQLNTAMKATQVFPAMLNQMVMIGEEAGSLDSMLNKIASIYQAEVDDAVDGLSSMLEPVIMVFLGVVIGGLVIAMYLPIFTMGSVIK